MASYTYTVTLCEPTNDHRPPVWTEMVTRNAAGIVPWTAANAISYARTQHERPDGTRIAIHRQRLSWAMSASSRWGREPKPKGPELPYRTYEVQGGIVRRTDR